MKIGIKIALTTLLSAGIFLLSHSSSLASEGKAIMGNTQGGPSRCLATSVLMPDFDYNILVTCRELIYPANPELLNYVVWINPLAGGNAVKLGDLSVGKRLFKTKTSFGSVFVTQERDKNVKAPTGAAVMRGSVRAFDEIENGSTFSPDETFETPSPSASPRPASRLSGIFRTGTIVLVISVALIILMLVLVKPFK